jgi:hypothetical protein
MAQQQEHMEQGTVEAVNDRGVKIGGAWWNFSKFSEVAPPQVGQEVQLLIRGDRWVQACKVLGADGQVVSHDEYNSSRPFDGPQDDDPGTWGYGTPPKASARPAPAPPAPKGRATLRAAALAAASHFHSTGDGKEDDVYATAYRFLAWIESDD